MMRKSGIASCIAAAAMFLLVGCGSDRAETDTAADTAAIKTVSEQMTNAYIVRDWNAFAGFFTDDGIWMPPGVAPLQGKDAWWTFVQPWWNDSTVVEMDVSSEEIIVSGDWAVERHTERQLTTFGDGGEPAQFYFKGIWILRRQADGTWRIARYIWNENISSD